MAQAPCAATKRGSTRWPTSIRARCRQRFGPWDGWETRSRWACSPRRCARNADPEKANLFLAEAAVEALGRIGTPEAIAALIQAFSKLPDYPQYTRWYGDHEALMACHASPVHYFIIEALDAIGATNIAADPAGPHTLACRPIRTGRCCPATTITRRWWAG